ncbi:MAG: 2-oxopent-4-enoate hydratase, partial [Proteobacteria bacterium]|nr:2-oxopent-4-enoate hydratase [Pseudomonadota bacterium]
LPAQPVRLLIDGVLCQEGTGALVLGDPSNVLVWLANALSAQGLAIAAGEFVLTGTMTGLHAPEPGQTAVADFGSLGIVEVVFG